jgi:hypothetical protein
VNLDTTLSILLDSGRRTPHDGTVEGGTHVTISEFRPLNVYAGPATRAGERNRRWLGSVDADLLFEQIAPGFRPDATLDLVKFQGRTIQDLVFTNYYIDPAAWNLDDRKKIDDALSAAMTDARLNGVMAQYYTGPISSTFTQSHTLPALGSTVSKTDLETLVARLHNAGTLAGMFANTVFCFLLGPGVVLDDSSPGAAGGGRASVDKVVSKQDAANSLQGLGGFHGSVHVGADTVYYAVGVFSEPLANGGENGIVAFDLPWKNVVATFYHELNEARTDPDVEDAIRAGNDPKATRFLGWYSPRAGEIGDIPITEAGTDLSTVMMEVPLANGSGTVPVQLMYSNRDHGPAEQ